MDMTDDSQRVADSGVPVRQMCTALSARKHAEVPEASARCSSYALGEHGVGVILVRRGQRAQPGV